MKQDEKTQLAEVHAALRLRGWTTQQLERGFDGLRIEDAIERGEYILACALKADKKRDEAIFAAIDRLKASEDEKAALRFADWGGFEEEIEADADKAAKDRLAVLRTEDSENDFHSRQAEQIRQSTERVEARAVRS